MNTYKITATVVLEISNATGQEYTHRWPCSETVTAPDEGAALAAAEPLLIEQAETQWGGIQTDIIDCDLLNVVVTEITPQAVMLALPRSVAPQLPGLEDVTK